MNSYWCWEENENGVLIYADSTMDANLIFREQCEIPEEETVYVEGEDIGITRFGS